MPFTQPDGYLVQAASGQGRPVLVLHPWWGLNDTIKNYCNRLAEAGYTVFAPDLYHGKVVDTIPEATDLSSALFDNLDKARSEVGAASAYFSELADPAGKGMAVIGFSLGGFFALDLSNRAPARIRAVVIYYATGPDDFTASQAEYLGHFAEKDHEEPEENVQALEATLDEAGRSATFYRYPGTGHWFAEPDRTQAYNKEAAELAWERTLAFLGRA
jgi:carboxymethylenebutenolidase